MDMQPRGIRISEAHHYLFPGQAARYCGVSPHIFDSNIAPSLTLRPMGKGLSGYAIEDIDCVVFGDQPPQEPGHALEDNYVLAISSVAGDLASTAKKRARRRGWKCNIDRDYIEWAIESQDFRCAMTGIKFDVAPYPSAGKRPWAPSVDRIDRAKGYTRANVRIICAAANLAMNVWDESVLVAVAEGIVGMRQGR